MTDLATWIAAIAALASACFAWLAVRSQRAAVDAQEEATAAAREAAASADKAQRIQFRPALHVSFQQHRDPDVDGMPVTLALAVRNVGHGTAVIEGIRLFQYGNASMEYHDTRGAEQKLTEQFDGELFLRLAGVRLESTAELHLPPLTDIDRALETGATRTIFSLRITDTTRAARIVDRFREGLTAQVMYRSLAGDAFNTDQQFQDLRE